jgi:hypothetical protein
MNLPWHSLFASCLQLPLVPAQGLSAMSGRDASMSSAAFTGRSSLYRDNEPSFVSCKEGIAGRFCQVHQVQITA